MSVLNVDIEKSENELKLITYNLDKGNQLEELLSRTFQTIENTVSMETPHQRIPKTSPQKIVVS